MDTVDQLRSNTNMVVLPKLNVDVVFSNNSLYEVIYLAVIDKLMAIKTS